MLEQENVTVLSPERPYPAEWIGEFLFVESDESRLIHHVQDRHLRAIREASFVWLCCSDGYVGISAALEIGFALACGTPLFSVALPSNETLAKFVQVVPGPAVAVVLMALAGHALLDASKLYSSKQKSEAESRMLQQVRRGIALSVAPELQPRLPL
jgi:type IV secretory pathway VirB2 component (pilin)